MIHLRARLRVHASYMNPKLAPVFDARLFKKRANGAFAHVFCAMITAAVSTLNCLVCECAVPEPVFWIFAAEDWIAALALFVPSDAVLKLNPEPSPEMVGPPPT